MFRQKDYPKQIVVKDAIWDIKFVRQVPDGSSRASFYTTFGLCDPCEKVIYIRMGMDAKERLVTFVHEVLHAFEEEYRIKLKHPVINKIQYPLAEFIMENCISMLTPVAVLDKSA